MVWGTVTLLPVFGCGNREDLTLPVGIYWNCVFGCAGGRVTAPRLAVAPGGAGCSLRGCRVIVYFWVDHLRNDWVVLFVLHDPSDGLDEGIGGFHQSFCLR